MSKSLHPYAIYMPITIWLFALFFNIMDIAALPDYILHIMIIRNETYNRFLFVWELGKILNLPFIQNQLQKCTGYEIYFN